MFTLSQSQASLRLVNLRRINCCV